MNKEITYTQFQDMVKNEQISKVIITSDNLIITPNDKSDLKGKTLYTVNIKNDDLLKELNAAHIDVTGQNPKQSPIFDFLLIYGLPIIIFWILVIGFIVYKIFI